MAHLKIDAPSEVAHNATVELDGEPIANGCLGIDLRMHVGEVITATLQLRVAVDFDGEARPVLSEETASLLKRLGWAPPAEAADWAAGGGP
jgi:hypothetical protein